MPRGSKPRDLSGLRFGRLTAREVSHRKYQKVIWRCECECGEECFVAAGHLVSGHTTNCGCVRAEKVKAFNATRKGRPISHWTSSIIAMLKGRAKAIHVEMLLNKEDIQELCLSDCTYCGMPPSNALKRAADVVLYQGIDRIDSSIGYVRSNCAPCCKRCNIAKNDMSLSDFKEMVARQYIKMHKD